MKRENGC